VLTGATRTREDEASRRDQTTARPVFCQEILMSSSSGLLTPDAPGSESSPRSAPNGLSRRSFLGAAAVATWTALDGGAMRPAAATAGARTRASTAAIRPFRIKVPQGQLAELRRRLAATRWSSRELVADRSQGVQLATIQAVADFWAAEHDWRRTEAKLNALPQFKTEIDGLDIHFIHVRSRHEGALPLIMTHGWPGSIIELLEVVGPLTDPTANGGRAEDAFDLVLPSLPGYGFSGEPTEIGWDPGRAARAWAELMRRLGYTRYVAQGGDVGALVTDMMGRQAPQGLIGIHTNLLVTALAGPQPANTDEERAALDALTMFRTTGSGYVLEQSTRPQTIGYALLDSPVALAAWMLDHDTDSYYKISRAFLGGPPSGHLTPDRILDNITLYWLTSTGTSAARSYWESARATALAAGRPPAPVTIPVGFTTFPGEIFQAPRSWVEMAYPTLVYFNTASRGGHFAAWEEPEVFAAEIRAAFRAVRS
jgi:pimeloyl-ACP methyl ester carboxylesterase